ncbi:hypothetical protein GCM10022223_61690 [Kineosporia mesophila]|uniref:Uncharacterized protein n=1 Tax=Kineosporia mesophila TaxID=566012 RepID=A0ABP7AL42_9ACTN
MLLPGLESLHRAWLGDEDEFQERLQFALLRCATDARARAVVAEDEVIAWEGGPGAAVISRSRSYPHTVMHVHDGVTGEHLYSSALWPDEEPWSLNAPQHAESLRLTAPDGVPA